MRSPIMYRPLKDFIQRVKRSNRDAKNDQQSKIISIDQQQFSSIYVIKEEQS